MLFLTDEVSEHLVAWPSYLLPNSSNDSCSKVDHLVGLTSSSKIRVSVLCNISVVEAVPKGATGCLRRGSREVPAFRRWYPLVERCESGIDNWHSSLIESSSGKRRAALVLDGIICVFSVARQCLAYRNVMPSCARVHREVELDGYSPAAER